MRMIAAIFLLMAVATAPVQALGGLPAAMKSSAPWKVSGVGLGMTPKDVGAALNAAGYVLEYRYLGRSWQGELASKASFLRGGQIPTGGEVISKEDYRKGQEFIQIAYLAGPSGPYVARVIYRIPTSAIDAERFRTAALGRYGRPSLKGEWEDVYCSAGERQCSRIVSLVTNQLPSLTVHALNGTNRTLELRQGRRADQAYEAAVNAEVERLYPKKTSPPFDLESRCFGRQCGRRVRVGIPPPMMRPRRAGVGAGAC